jgi:hypothetical protein
MRIKILLVLLFSFLFSENVLTSIPYEEEIKEGIVVVEYWAHWNIENRVVFIYGLKNAKIFDVNTCDNPDLQTKNGVIVVPTIIFYDNGVEYKRLQGDLSFKLKTTYEELQKIIDDRLMINQEK